MSTPSNYSSLSVIGSFSHLFEGNLVWRAASQTPKSASQEPLLPEHFPAHLIKSGTVHEWFTKSKAKSDRYIPPLTLIAQLLRKAILRETTSSNELQNRYVLWIGEESWPTPYLLASTDLLTRSLFIKAPDEKLKLWAIDTALHSQGIAAVIAHCKNLRFPLSQRFSLAAKSNNSLAVLFRPFSERMAPSAASGRWLVESCVSSQMQKISQTPTSQTPTWKVQLLKSKGAMPERQDWVLTGDMDHDCSNSKTASAQENSLHVLSASAFAMFSSSTLWERERNIHSEDQFQIAL